MMEPRQQSALRQNVKVTSRNGAGPRQQLKWPSSGKENAPSVKPKNAVSGELVIREMKATASKTLTNIKSTFDNISQKLRRSSRKRSSSSLQPYEELDNHTPVKLYSPFDIVTPSPRKEAVGFQSRQRLTPRRFAFVSPTGKFKKDVDDLSKGIRELHTVARSLHGRKSRNKEQ